MKESLGLELYSELKRAFGDILPKVLWAMVAVSLAFVAYVFYFKCYALCSTAVELFVFTLLLAVIGTMSWMNVQKKVNRYLSSLTTDEKDLLFYIYDHSKKATNAVYVPYDNAVAISLKYKRILRRYETPRIARKKNSEHNKYCFLYGIRKKPLISIDNREIQCDNLPSANLRAYLDKYQYNDEDRHIN